MCDRCSLILCTKAFIPTAFSFWSCWRSTSRAMVVPVLPTPALGHRIRQRSALRSESGKGKGTRVVWIHLQWTTVGVDAPSLCMWCLTSPLNWIRSSVFSGTPWSGQTVKWKCFTLYSPEVCLCEHADIRPQLHFSCNKSMPSGIKKRLESLPTCFTVNCLSVQLDSSCSDSVVTSSSPYRHGLLTAGQYLSHFT